MQWKFWQKKAAPPVRNGDGGSGFAFGDILRGGRAASADTLIAELLGTAYTCATLNADLIASTPIRLYVRTRAGQKKSRLAERGRTRRLSKSQAAWVRKTPQSGNAVGGGDEVEEVTDHPILDLLRNPAGDDIGKGLSWYGTVEVTQLYLETVGLCYWYIDRSGPGDTPVAIWVLPPHLTQPQADGTYLFTSGSTQIRYQADEVIAFRMPDLNNPYGGGKSPMTACFEQVTMFRTYAALTAAMLKNGGKPSAIWSPKGDSEGSPIGTAEAKRMAVAMQQSFGQSKSGGILTSEYPGTLQPLNWPMNQVLSDDAAKQQKVLVANCFQVPTTKIDRADATMASATTGDFAHAKDAGLPRCQRFSDTLNATLVRMFDPDGRLFVAFDSCVPADTATITAQLKDGMSAGAVLRNEYRDAIGLQDEPWGAVPLVPNTMLAVDDAGKPDRPAVTPNQAADGQMPALRAASVKRARPEIINATDNGIARSLSSGPFLKAVLQSAFESQRRSVMAAISREVAKSVETKESPKQQANRVRRARQAIVGAVIGMTARMTEDVQPVVSLTLRQEGMALLVQVQAQPTAFAALEQQVGLMATELAKRLCESVNESTVQQLEAAVEAIAAEIEGELMPDTPDAADVVEGELVDPAEAQKRLTAKVNEVFDDAAKRRADTIARTEASRATHQAELAAAKASGVVRLKKWLLSEDACPICDQIVADHPDGIPLGKTFAELGGKYGSIEHPPAHPNCVCSLTYVTTDAPEDEQ